MNKLLIFVLLLYGCSASIATRQQTSNTGKGPIDPKVTKSFLPDNNFSQTKKYAKAGEVTEEDFDDVMEAIRTIYEPIIWNHGATLNVYGNWSDNTVNAYAEQAGTAWNVSFFGGLARHPFMTREGFAMVACHEIGHHVAGYPSYPGEWASNEGNSDFYATASCAKLMFDENSPLLFMKKKPKPKPTPVPTDCVDSVCKLSLEAGLSLGKVLAELNDEPNPSYDTPDTSKVSTTYDSHPKAQCRVDTYRYGAYCDKQWNHDKIPQSLSDMVNNSCSDRPKCWYAR
jgi:hypothetical protein